jgi:hypothetical protein
MHWYAIRIRYRSKLSGARVPTSSKAWDTPGLVFESQINLYTSPGSPDKSRHARTTDPPETLVRKCKDPSRRNTLSSLLSKPGRFSTNELNKRKHTIVNVVTVAFVQLFLAFFICSLNNELIVKLGSRSSNRSRSILESRNAFQQGNKQGLYMHSLVPFTEFFGRIR